MSLLSTLQQLPSPGNTRAWRNSIVAALVLMLVVAQGVTGYLWSREPAMFNVVEQATTMAQKRKQDLITGYITTATLIHTTEVLLDKSGGYLSNDALPPGVLMDNIPNWEAGALAQIRDMTLAMRNDIGREQTQALEDTDLTAAESLLRVDMRSWMFPAAESEYSAGIEALYHYLDRLGADASFNVQADNLDDWLALVEKRLSALSQHLAANVDDAALPAGYVPATGVKEPTPLAKVDDVFYEARGTAWALSHLLRAVEIDFQDVLAQKNAQASLQQVIRDLETAQTPLWSPVILSGNGFGIFANHSLVMANYISHAHTNLEDLRLLLAQE
jgi:hypothetical protein